MNSEPVSVEVVSQGTPLALPTRITLNEWAEQARQLLNIDRRVKWTIGKWIQEGCERFSLTHEQASLVIGVDRSTITHYVRVVRAFPDDVDQQRFDVDWAHYRAVADLPEPEREELLELAESRKLTSNELEREVRRRYPLPKPQRTASNITYRGSITVTGDNPDIVRQAVEQTAKTLEEWFTGYDGHIDVIAALPKCDQTPRQ